MTLRLFLDSADPAAWSQWLPVGLFYGITTNPTLLSRARQPCRLEHLAGLSRQALQLGCRELHLQAWGEGARELEGCGRALAALAPGRVTVKLPINLAGTTAAQRLIETGIPITFTAGYEVAQVLVAAALGARYFAPYLGRICDQGRDGQAELTTMQRCLDGVDSNLRLLVASLRAPSDLVRLAAAGIDTFTISPAIAGALFESAATEKAAAQFARDAQDS
ncbi:MAG: transaldolase family protein [Cyanobium sp.]